MLEQTSSRERTRLDHQNDRLRGNEGKMKPLWKREEVVGVVRDRDGHSMGIDRWWWQWW